MDWLGGAIGAVGNVLGGLFGKSAADKQTAMQKEFAQNGIQWRVRDATKAGIHPLYALGAQVTPYSPVQVGDMGLSAAGQDLSRAYMATRTEGQKVDLFTKQSQALQLQRLGLENELLAAQIKKTNQPSDQAPFPGSSYMIPGQTQSGVVSVPMQQTVAGIAPNREPAPIRDVGYAYTNSGYAPVPSKDVKDRIEDNFMAEMQWFLRNNVLPSFGVNKSPPYKAPPGKYWAFNPARQEYQLVDEKYSYTMRALSQGRY